MRFPLHVQQWLEDRSLPYEVLVHPQVDTPRDAAAHGYIPLARLVHAVLLEDRRGPLLAVLAANQQLDLHALNRQLQRDLELADPERARTLFPDCDPRALPPLGEPYGVKAIVDERLYRLAELYFQPGAGTALVQMSGRDFEGLMADAWRGFDFASGDPGEAPDNSGPQVDLMRRLQQIDHLPAMPAMAQRILQVRANPYAGARELAQVVELDPSLAAQVMRYARAPFFGYPGPIDSVQDAIARVLGYDMVMNITLGIATGAPFRMQAGGRLGMTAFWRHAVYCAALTQNLAKALPLSRRPPAGLAYLAGLLHNFGFLLMGYLFETEYFWLNKQADRHPDLSITHLEHQMLQTDHTELGAWLLQAWQLPAEVVAAVRHHHEVDYRGDHCVYPNLVLVANRLLARDGTAVDASPELPDAVLADLALSHDQSEIVLEAVRQGQSGLDTMARQLAA
ncbi:MAG: HDOD domain-containing protein [Gammaproteobacteria bacterium]